MNATGPTMLTPAARRDQFIARVNQARNDDELVALTNESTDEFRGRERGAILDAIRARQVVLHQQPGHV